MRRGRGPRAAWLLRPPSKLEIQAWLSAVTFCGESDLTEPTQAAEEIANTRLGDGEGLGSVDELDERSGCKEPPVVPECLPETELPLPSSAHLY